MVKQLIEQKERRVVYAELVYDLIFVYIVGRNNALLHHTVDGFFTFDSFMVYFTCTLAVIQIWNFTTYYINAYGRNGARDYVFLFTNMFLMFFLARSTQANWQSTHQMYHIAWALILVNIGAQYLIELRNHRGEPAQLRRIRRMAIILLTEAAIVGLSTIEFSITGTSYTSAAAIIFGVAAAAIIGHRHKSGFVDFEHLSERAMLYVVLTFGEMIIAIAGYFEGEINFNTLYYAGMAFLIVVGLFLSYGLLYDHVVDRKMETNGLGYMFIHIFLILSLNNITLGLEFMREDEVDLFLKMVFLVISLLVYFGLLLATGRYAKKLCHLNRNFYFILSFLGTIFTLLMLWLRENMAVNIAITVLFVFGVYLILYVTMRKMEQE